uniref:Uncharacterized protein n=1 Tax=Alexandrium monilatum TaxID=311494 RepID=A0A7S4RL98_9DINO|mmetsp:Transcript_41572/g.129549  ORF Transcript_41572/g.129549 Transcript_41572/m.129549 type:complete len:392 (+) Transcript_41572:56-1231(+)
MSTPAVFDGDEVWDFNSSSEEEDIDSDVIFQDGDDDEPPSPRPSAARSSAPPATGSGAPAPTSSDGMAALLGRLRCDNLELRKALVEAQREAEAAAMAFQREQNERRRLQAILEEVARQRAAAEAAAAKESASSRAVPTEPEPHAQLAPVAETEEAEEAPAAVPGPREAASASSSSPAPGGAAEDGQAPRGFEAEERLALERQLVSSKIKCAAAVERVEGLEAILEAYEGQLKALNPNFRPADISQLGRPKQRLPAAASGAAQPGSEVDSNSPHTPGMSPHTPGQSPPNKEKHHKSGKHRIKKWAGRMFKSQGSGHHASSTGEAEAGQAAAAALPAPGEDIARQKEVISCLMDELEKANQKIQKYKSKSSKKKGHHHAEAAASAEGDATVA